MELSQKQTHLQKLVLTQAMRQSLDCLQLAALELNEYVARLSLSNPLLEVQTFSPADTSLHEIVFFEQQPDLRYGRHAPGARCDTHRRGDFTAFLAQEITFRGYLEEQIGQMRLADPRTVALCRFLIDCLDDRGYLSWPIEELAECIGCPVGELEQALFALQMLDPPGVGARNLSECLTLQLAQSRDFNRLTLSIVRNGLELLARRRYDALAEMLCVGVEEARQASEAVLALNPIPSRGFPGERQVIYTVPDAFLWKRNNRLVVEFNERILPRVSINEAYAALLDSGCDAETRRYIREKLAAAQAVIRGLRSRSDTLRLLLSLLIGIQRDYFFGGDLRPLTMQELAERMDVSVSTVSRAVQGKSIQFEGRTLPLRDFFTTALPLSGGGRISVQTIRLRIRHLIRSEDPAAPLSDEAICLALQENGVDISRRTVAKYRAGLGIEAAHRRRR